MVGQNMAQYSLGMSLATAELPTDPAELHAFALACQSELKAAETAVHEGQTFFFCASGCRSRFEADAGRYLPLET